MKNNKLFALVPICFLLTACIFESDVKVYEMGEWAKVDDYQFRVESIENTKVIKSTNNYKTQNWYMCILIELLNDSSYSHIFSDSNFKVYDGKKSYSSKSSEALAYSKNKDDYPSLYLSDSLGPSLSGKYYIVFETPKPSTEGEYQLEYEYSFDSARVNLKGGTIDEASNIPLSGEVTFDQMSTLVKQLPEHPYKSVSVTGTISGYTDEGQYTSHSYSETWTYSLGYWSLKSYFPDQSGINFNHLCLAYFVDYLSDSAKEKCKAYVDPFKIVSKGMKSVLDTSLLENSTYIWDDYGLIKSIDNNTYSSNSTATAHWTVSTSYSKY